MMRTAPRHLVLAAALTGMASAGDLDPPGPPASTPAIEPRTAISQENTPGDASALFIISAPGSYYLPQSIFNSTASPRHGIVIAAGNVTIDLGGFTLDGFEVGNDPLRADPQPHGPVPPTEGIRASGEIEGVTILNGTLREWTGRGVNLEGVDQARIEGVTVIDCGTDGIRAGRAAVVTHCIARGNGGQGIWVVEGSVISECTAHDNGNTGVVASRGCTVVSCSSMRNDDDGFLLSTNGLIIQCVASDNGGDGIYLVNGDNRAINNTCGNNGASPTAGHGILSNSGDHVEGNTLLNNDVGLLMGGNGGFAVRNTARGNGANYDISGAHTVGPIESASNPITTINPWANFSL